MAPTPLSESAFLLIAASAIATIFVGFGVNAILRPLNALEPFEFQSLALASDKRLVEGLLVIYGVRDIFMGVAIYATAYFRARKPLGWILIGGSGVALVDGIVCLTQVGKGQWNHWGYAPMVTVLGSLLLGILDRA
ncbi:hypothetical protein PLICRDRAFT_274211 [Plicaturopsis crispa FD-325 SS-3]|nr:hypothetical protein PLICRDRAFT_274211 [Plicaturopsis crispa FD-325 SS-3]